MSLDRPTPVQFGAVLLVAATAFTVWSGAVHGLSAQRVRTTDTGSAPLRVDQMVPRSGPPGTRITLQMDSLGPLSPYRIGIGATGTGFEEVGQILSTMEGEIELNVTVPSWPKPDHASLVIVFDVYFRPLAFSDPFHVTDAEGMVRREGMLADEGSGCMAFTDRDGFTYNVTGETGDFGPGDEVIIDGTIAGPSVCPDPNTIRVVRIRSRRG